MIQERPRRHARTPAAAAAEPGLEADQRRLDGEAVRAVLETAGQEYHRAHWRTSWPAGLSDREVEVLRLVARGDSLRQVAPRLTISPKTSDHHVQHSYAKIGVSRCAAAAMFAMDHQLLPR